MYKKSFITGTFECTVNSKFKRVENDNEWERLMKENTEVWKLINQRLKNIGDEIEKKYHIKLHIDGAEIYTKTMEGEIDYEYGLE